MEKFKRNNWENTYEVSSASRPRRGHAHRRRRQDRRRDYHSRYREGEPSEGEIIAVGPGGRDENGKLVPIDLKTGDRVLFGKWSGTEVKIDGVDYLIMKESDIMGVLDQSVARKKAA
jgi:co-chaperonin GroES (HSP10)